MKKNKKKIVNFNQKGNWKNSEMKVDWDIQLYKIRHLPDCVSWTCLFKSIKDNINKNTNEID